MAHQLDFINDQHSIAWRETETPWHGLGQSMPDGQPLEIWAERANMNWTIQQAPVIYCADGDTQLNYKEMPKRSVLYRSDSQAALAIVNPNKYKIVQPKEVLEFFRDIIAAGDFEMEVAGVLQGGKKFWALAKTHRTINLSSEDVIEPYLLLTTGADGQTSTTAQFTSVRVVCNNTLQMSLNESSSARIRIPHVQVFNPNEIKAELGLIDAVTADFTETIRRLANTRISDRQAEEFVIELFGGEAQVDLHEQERNKHAMLNVYDLYRGLGQGSRLDTTHRTAWGVVNAVTEFADYKRRSKNQDTRLTASWFGEGARLKQRAVDSALRLAA